MVSPIETQNRAKSGQLNRAVLESAEIALKIPLLEERRWQVPGVSAELPLAADGHHRVYPLLQPNETPERLGRGDFLALYLVAPAHSATSCSERAQSV